MCGISGIFSLSDKPLDSAELYAFHDAISHRGPDDEGMVLFYNDKLAVLGGAKTPTNVYSASYNYSPKTVFHQAQPGAKAALAHQRLSIIDTSEGAHQPICSPDGRYWMVYNGEIYNYLEIKAELIHKGMKFFTNSDTEVLLNAYIMYGKNLHHHLNGMWAFCIYDTIENILFLSRDRNGIKPLYFYKNSDFFVFGSEIKQFLKLKFFNKIISETAVFNYLILEKTEYNHISFLKNIHELLPSNYLYFDLKNTDLSVNNYYKFIQNSVNYSQEELYHKIEKSVLLRLRSDVPLGTTLSGGIDSTAITAITAKHIGNQLHTFTSMPDKQALSEQKWAQLVSTYYSCRAHYDVVSAENVLNDIEKLVYYQDIPFMNLNTYMQYSLMKNIRNAGIKVVLEGQGADELFAGYNRHIYHDFILKFLQFNFKDILKSRHIYLSFIYFLKWLVYKSIPPFLFYKFQCFNHDIYKFYNQNFLKSHNNILLQYLNHYSFSKDILIKDFFGNDLKTMYRCGDRNSMAHGVESRMPFADDLELFEYALNIPWPQKVASDTLKYCLREATKHLLPPQIYSRNDKVGFVSAQDEWLFELKQHFKIYIDDRLSPYVNPKEILKNWDHLFYQAKSKGSNRLWRVLNLAIWLKSM